MAMAYWIQCTLEIAYRLVKRARFSACKRLNTRALGAHIRAFAVSYTVVSVALH